MKSLAIKSFTSATPAPLKRFLATRFGRNLLWLLGAEAINRATRLGTIVVLGRTLDSAQFGVAAIAVVSFELLLLFNETGAGQQIVRARDEELEAVCRRANQIFWTMGLTLGLCQIAVGALFSWWMDQPSLLLMGAMLSLVFFGMPLGLVRIFRTKRANRLDRIARIRSSQISTENVLTLAMALCGAGAWAMVAPKFLTFPIWLYGARRCDGWRVNKDVAAAPFGAFLAGCWPVMLSEVANGFRVHLDKLIIGALLGAPALGVYYMAFNAGLGLSTSIAQGFAQTLYSHLCEAGRHGRDILAALRKALAEAGLPLALLLLTQAAAAPFYVRLLLGPGWETTGNLAGVLCLAAAPKLFGDAVVQAIRATGKLRWEPAYALLTGLALCMASLFGAQGFGLYGAAIGYSAAAWLVQVPLALCVLTILNHQVKKERQRHEHQL